MRILKGVAFVAWLFIEHVSIVPKSKRLSRGLTQVVMRSTFPSAGDAVVLGHSVRRLAASRNVCDSLELSLKKRVGGPTLTESRTRSRERSVVSSGPRRLPASGETPRRRHATGRALRPTHVHKSGVSTMCSDSESDSLEGFDTEWVETVCLVAGNHDGACCEWKRARVRPFPSAFQNKTIDRDSKIEGVLEKHTRERERETFSRESWGRGEKVPVC